MSFRRVILDRVEVQSLFVQDLNAKFVKVQDFDINLPIYVLYIFDMNFCLLL